MQKRLTPPQKIVLGFISIITLGTTLLMLPFSNTKGCSLIDALFTATSAVCVTGLIVKDIPNDFTFFGHLIILILIQIGGLGYMTFSTLIALIIGKRIGIRERIVIKHELQVENIEGIVKFAKSIFIFTLIFESAGTFILTLRFLRYFEPEDAFLRGLFHSVSAFNNAGFSLFSENLLHFKGDILVNIIVPILIIIGGVGFFVINELYMFFKKEINRLSQHTKIILLTTSILIIFGATLIFMLEASNPKTFGILSTKEKIFVSYFSAITPRTAGFNTIDYSLLKTETLFVTVILMFIGASPGGTGGGIKTSTFAIVLATLFATIRGKQNTVIFKRRVPQDVVSKSFLLVTLAAIFCTLSTFSIVTTQNIDYLPAMFEVTSAFGTVGLSIGDGGVRSLSALFSTSGKLIIILSMFIGRLGPLTLAFSITRQVVERFRYPEGRVIIG
ncbi:MAG: hypothetical protein HXY47_07415 [Nitrospirae bacterium]|nr:hypothetical protein [Nitrospirota bacterium]